VTIAWSETTKAPRLFGESVTLEEMEGDTEEGPKKGGDHKAEGDDIPDEYKGKSVAEIIKMVDLSRDGMRTALSAAESARQAAELAAASRQPAPQIQDEGPKELTREELKALYDEDPLAAIEKIEEQAARRVNAHIEARLAPLTSGTMNSAENWAREEFPDEFELFEKDIKALIAGVPNKTVFTSKEGWQDAIAYVRGKGGNFEKLVDHRLEKKNATDRDTSRTRERERTGFSGRSTNAGNTRAPDNDRAIADKMGDDQRRIAQSFIDAGTFKNMSEYMTWYNKGGA
jgi:hypothetical protein